MRKAALLLACLLCGPAHAVAEGATAKWATLFLARLVPDHASIARLYAGREAIFAQYTVAMRRLKAAGDRGRAERMAIAFQPREGLPALEPFTWVASNGDMVRRTGDGVFSLAAGSALGNWTTDVTCRVTMWPMLACSDERERKMSAPDLETLIFDGVAFKRPYPVAAFDPEEPILPPDDTPN